MPPEPKRILQHEVISPTLVMLALRPEDRHGSAVMVSHNEAARFARAILADLDPDDAGRLAARSADRG